MGKKARRTRWRTLTIADEQSDSEESNTTTSSHKTAKGYSQKYSRFTYSSQSTPTRRYQYDGAKSTRSSSTASENKITFNEDEYTRITTPRQDVLFKKGYLNKPKTYQTQTSTGNSTTSTGNSTGNGTPDHQSTDLEYESQFVFPNGFVDQNGIYYVNSFEPFPVMVYNPPTYYPECTNVKTKRCSTGSLTESTSANNEETCQGEVYNVMYPGYYYNGVCQAQDTPPEAELRRVKKRRRRKRSRSKQETSESSEEILTDEEAEEAPPKENVAAQDQPHVLVEHEAEASNKEEKPKEAAPSPPPEETPQEVNENADAQKEETKDESGANKKDETRKYDLKPDAEEFVPRAYRHHETIPMETMQFIKIPPSFVPVPMMPMGEFNAFIPPGIPINFVPQNFVNFVPYVEEVKEETKNEVKEETVEVPIVNNNNKKTIDIEKIVSKLEEAAKEQDETTTKDEAKNKNVGRKKLKYHKVELRPTREWKTRPVPNGAKKEEIDMKKPVRNYSDTLKKPMTAQHGQNGFEKTKLNKSPVKEPVKNNQGSEEIRTKLPTDWIPVSRKKRKNKNEEKEEAKNDAKTETKVVEEEDSKSEEQTPNEEIKTVEIEVQEEESEVKTEEIEVTNDEQKEEITEEILTPKREIKEERKKKKTKKNQQKSPVLKKVIITDLDLSAQFEEKAEECETKVEEVKDEEENKVVVEVIEENIEEVSENKEISEKKPKKKKKKASPKASLKDSSNLISTGLNEDSYDFLRDDSLEKTNIEVSQELDKMIQRGMYSSLEEKMKSMNIESSSDGFFKSIISNISSESSMDKQYMTASNNITRLITKPNYDMGDFLIEVASPGEDGTVGSADDSYPITKAVRDWLMKTKESAPGVAVLKSPSEILKEFSRRNSSSSIEEAEEVLEEYEDISSAEGNAFPRAGTLPYRAICCSIM